LGDLNIQLDVEGFFPVNGISAFGDFYSPLLRSYSIRVISGDFPETAS
jgi:hypothetical protein